MLCKWLSRKQCKRRVPQKSLLQFLSGYSLLRDPHHNKGLAFTEKERDAHYLRSLLHLVVMSQELQIENRELLLMRRVAAYIYRKAGRWKRSKSIFKEERNLQRMIIKNESQV